jgi:hypothetical protein
VLEEDHFARFFLQRLLGGVRFEGQLHPLPVALVEVVELVEVPEEPVLQGEAVVVRFAGDMGVGDRRCLFFQQQLLEVAGVDADVLDRRRFRDVFELAARFVVSLQRHRRVAEHRFDTGRLVLLGRGFAGRVLLFAQHRDRHVLLRQLLRRFFFGLFELVTEHPGRLRAFRGRSASHRHRGGEEDEKRRGEERDGERAEPHHRRNLPFSRRD